MSAWLNALPPISSHLSALPTLCCSWLFLLPRNFDHPLTSDTRRARIMAEEVQVEQHVEENTVLNAAGDEPESLKDAIRIVIRNSLEANGLIRGLSEVARALDRRTAHMCVLAADCEDEEYKKLIKALATQASIDFVEVESRDELAAWAGLQKHKGDGTVKTFKCSCVAIRDFGDRTRALDMLLSQLAN